MVEGGNSDGEPQIISERLKGTVRRTIVPHPEAVVAGWAFGVPMPAFAAAFDVLHQPYLFTQILSDGGKRDVTRMLWTRGAELAFEVGDTFHSPPLPAGPWGDQMKHLTHTIQVVGRQGDALQLSIHLWKAGTIEKRLASHRELAEWLATGLPAPIATENRTPEG